MNKIENQIRENFHKAFYDKIDETVNSKSVDYEWIVRLYEEIKNRLLRYVAKGSKTFRNIDDDFDTILFEQMIRNEAFDTSSMLKLVNNTYYWLGRLQSQARDISTEESKLRVLNSENKKMVSTFIREVNSCIDNIDEDLKTCFNK
jgi:hypothetical protein